MDKEPKKIQYFSDYTGLSEDNIEKYGIHLYHGIRFDAIDRLESILQSGYILPGNKVKKSFTSYDGNTKYMYMSYDDENCNMGKYISVMPEEEGIEFDIFVRENLFLAIKGSVKAIKTTHISYDDYCDLKNKNDDYYSYAFNEYFVPDSIPISDVLYIGIDSNYFKGNIEQTVEEVIKLINAYKIDIPFIDIKNNNEIYRLNSNNKHL